MNNTQQKGNNNGQNVWLDFITDNKDFLVSFRTRVRKISSALYMMGDLWREEDFGKHLMSVSLQVLEASKIPVTDNKDIITSHFMSVKEVVEYALSLIIFGAESNLLATSNVVLVTPFCVALLGDLHDLENTLPSLFDKKKLNRHITDISSELQNLFTKDHSEFSIGSEQTMGSDPLKQKGSDPIVRHPLQGHFAATEGTPLTLRQKGSDPIAPLILRHPATSGIHAISSDLVLENEPLLSPINSMEKISPSPTKKFDLSKLSQMQTEAVPDPLVRHPATSGIHAISSDPIEISDVAHDENNSEIFSIIKEKKTVTPQDLYNIFPDYSTKRVQRELQKLASEGKIEKRGEKRWVSYHLLSYR